MARRKRLQQDESQTPVGLPLVDLADTEPRVSEEAQQEAPVAAEPRAWRVLKATRVCLDGMYSTIPEGTLVTLRHYGPVGVHRIREQVEHLEPVF